MPQYPLQSRNSAAAPAVPTPQTSHHSFSATTSSSTTSSSTSAPQSNHFARNPTSVHPSPVPSNSNGMASLQSTIRRVNDVIADAQAHAQDGHNMLASLGGQDDGDAIMNDGNTHLKRSFSDSAQDNEGGARSSLMIAATKSWESSNASANEKDTNKRAKKEEDY